MTIATGSQIPSPPSSLWENVPEPNGPPPASPFPTNGKYLIVGVPGAFTPPCSSQVPGYLDNHQRFAAKGVKEIFVVAVNDVFVVKAWKEKLTAGKGSKVRFLADAKAEFVKSLGLEFDAAGLLGNVRSKRFVAVVDAGKVVNLKVEEEVPNVTVTAAENVLKEL